MKNSQEELVQRIINANKEIPAKGCRAQHATHGGQHQATFEVHDLSGELMVLAQGIFAEAATYPAIVRYSNGKEQDLSEKDVHGMAIKVFASEGPRLLVDPDDARAIDFILIDVDTFFSKDLGDYAAINEKLVPLLQRKQISDDRFSFWEALKGLASAAISPRLADDVWRLLRFRGETEPVEGVERWHLEYSSATPYKLGDVGPIKYKVLASRNGTDAGKVSVSFCIERPRNPNDIDVEDSTQSWKGIADPIPVATLKIETEVPVHTDVDRLRFNPWHVPPEHEPLGTINLARKEVYEVLANKRQREQD